MTNHDLAPDQTYQELEKQYAPLYALTQDQDDRIAELKTQFLELARRIIQVCPPGRDRSLALTNIQQGKMWAVSAIAQEKADG